jgi:hypothetical protein
MSARHTGDDSLPTGPDSATTGATGVLEDIPGVGPDRPVGGVMGRGEESGAAGHVESACAAGGLEPVIGPAAVPGWSVGAPCGWVADPGSAVGQYVRRIDPRTQRCCPFGQISMLVPSRSGVCWLVTFIDGDVDVWRVSDPDACYQFRSAEPGTGRVGPS